MLAAGTFVACSDGGDGESGGENSTVCKWVFDGDESSYYIFYSDKSVDVYAYGKLENQGLTKYSGDPTKAGETVSIKVTTGGVTQELISYKIESISGNVVTASSSWNGFELKFNMETGGSSSSGSGGSSTGGSSGSGNSESGGGNSTVCKWVFDNDESSYYIFYSDKSVDVYAYGKLENQGLTKYSGDPTKAGETVSIKVTTGGVTQELISYKIESISGNVVTASSSWNGFELKFNMETGGSSSSGSGGSSTKYNVYINVSNEKGGTVTVSDYAPSYGSTVTVTIFAYENYEIESIYAYTDSGSFVTFQDSTYDIDTTRYTFTMPASNVTVYVTFRANFSVTISENIEDGSISSWNSDGIIYLDICANDGYELDTLSVIDSNYSNIEVTRVYSNATNPISDGHIRYEFTMPESNVIVSATFKATNGDAQICCWEQEENGSNYFIFYADKTVEYYNNGSLRFTRSSYKYEGNPTNSGGTVTIKTSAGVTQFIFNVYQTYGSIYATENDSGTKFIKAGDAIICRWVQNRNSSNYYIFYADSTVTKCSGGTETPRTELRYEGDPTAADSTHYVRITDTNGTTLYDFSLSDGYATESMFSTKFYIDSVY